MESTDRLEGPKISKVSSLDRQTIPMTAKAEETNFTKIIDKKSADHVVA